MMTDWTPLTSRETYEEDEALNFTETFVRGSKE
jgi:hypothetical protein